MPKASSACLFEGAGRRGKWQIPFPTRERGLRTCCCAARQLEVDFATQCPAPHFRALFSCGRVLALAMSLARSAAPWKRQLMGLATVAHS